MVDFLPVDAGSVGFVASCVTLVTFLFVSIRSTVKYARNRRTLNSLRSERFERDQVADAVDHFIEPFCTSIDPSTHDEPRDALATEERAFGFLDRFLRSAGHKKYLILLADSGMGKTTLVVNYFLKRRMRYRFNSRENIRVIAMGHDTNDGSPEERIKRISLPQDVILILDAFDEDIKAQRGEVGRFYEILKITRDFEKVVITCRTQFFSDEDSIPRNSRQYHPGPRPIVSSGELLISHVYLSPFDDAQVFAYLRKRYPLWQFWNRSKRRQAKELVDRVPYLHVRPMLLAHIPDLVDSKKDVHFSFQLYEIMVEKWLRRERQWVDPKALMSFSKGLALNIFEGRRGRGMERVPREELDQLVEDWKVPLEDWKITGRSLLNRDSRGNFKFSHRSIMEYLVACCAVEGEPRCRQLALTDQTQFFIWEMYTDRKSRDPEFSLDLSGLDLAGLQPALRSVPSRDLWREELRDRIRITRCYDQQYNPFSPGRLHLFGDTAATDGKLLVDYASMVIYTLKPVARARTIAEAEAVARSASRQKAGGYDDWRVPTVEELLALSRGKPYAGLYLDPAAAGFSDRVISADGHGGRPWFVNYRAGGCFLEYQGAYDFGLHLVRSFSKES